MRTPPEGYLSSLKTMDRALDIRWGAVMCKWVIERRAYFGHDEVTYLKRRAARTERIARRKEALKQAEASRIRGIANQIAEEYLSALRGCRVIVYADTLDRRLFELLALSDHQRYGGFSRFVDRLEEEELRRERDEERQASNERNAVHKETFDKLNFIWAHRETQLLDGKRNLTELLK